MDVLVGPGLLLSHNLDKLWDKLESIYMAEGVNVRFAGELKRFIHQRVNEAGLYGSASEYIRDLVRHDYEREEARKWSWLRHELQSGATAEESEFIPLDAESIISRARASKKSHGGLHSSMDIPSRLREDAGKDQSTPSSSL